MTHFTVELEPKSAERIFGDRIDVARQFTADLAEAGERLGLIGPLEPPRLWSRHVVNSAIIAPLFWRNARVGDIGSGAGFPGLVLAIARPDLQLLLVEPMDRRVQWLRHESAQLGLTNVQVLRARAEEAQLDSMLDQATARAVSALTKLLPLVTPLVRPGGELVLMKGGRVDDEVAAAARVIRRLRLRDPETLTIGEGVISQPTRVFRATVPE